MPQSSAIRDQWARLGAMARLQDIEQERATILAAFPDLRARGAAVKVASVAAVSGGPRRRMSPAAKKAMSAGMRKYWARRKAAEAKAKTKG